MNVTCKWESLKNVYFTVGLLYAVISTDLMNTTIWYNFLPYPFKLFIIYL